LSQSVAESSAGDGATSRFESRCYRDVFAVAGRNPRDSVFLTSASEGLQQSDPIGLMKTWVRESVAAILCRVEQNQLATFDDFDLNERKRALGSRKGNSPRRRWRHRVRERWRWGMHAAIQPALNAKRIWSGGAFPPLALLDRVGRFATAILSGWCRDFGRRCVASAL